MNGDTTMTKTELAEALKAAGIDLTTSQIKKATVEDLKARLDATKAKKPAREPRGMEDRVIIEPGNADDVKPAKEGSKRALLIQALSRGTTVEHLMDLLDWNRPTVTSAIYGDVKAIGLGVERRGGKYFLIMPEGLTALPLRETARTRAKAREACK